MADDPSASPTTAGGPATVAVDVADADRFSVVVDRIAVTRPDGRPAAPSAPRVVEALDYLGERLRLIEIAPAEAMVRSAAPVDGDGGKQFYELRFEGDGMTMARRQAGGGEVADVAFVLPRATLDRLVGDLGRIVGSDAASAATPAEPAPGLAGDLFSGHKGCC
jgi:hypothetical protein